MRESWTLCCDVLQNTLATDSKKKASRPTTGKNNLPHQHLVHEQVELQGWQLARQRQRAVHRHQRSGRLEPGFERPHLGLEVRRVRLATAERQEQQIRHDEFSAAMKG